MNYEEGLLSSFFVFTSLFIYFCVIKMIDREKVKGIVSEWLKGRDYFLVDVTVDTDDKIVVEIDHKDGVWIEDCADLSDYVNSRLDRNVEDYELEVGSAGVGQPFKVLEQYVCHVGSPVEVMTADGEKVRGTLKEADATHFVVTEQQKVKLPEAKRPKLVDVDRDFDYNNVKYTKYLFCIWLRKKM